VRRLRAAAARLGLVRVTDRRRVAAVRSLSGHYDRDLSEPVRELSTRSEAFRTRRAAHYVRFCNTGIKRAHHSDVGALA
jgi:hypothetical protein